MQRRFPIEDEKNFIISITNLKLQIVVSWSRIRKLSVKADHSFAGVHVRPKLPLLISGNPSCEWNNTTEFPKKRKTPVARYTLIFEYIYRPIQFMVEDKTVIMYLALRSNNV